MCVSSDPLSMGVLQQAQRTDIYDHSFQPVWKVPYRIFGSVRPICCPVGTFEAGFSIATTYDSAKAQTLRVAERSERGGTQETTWTQERAIQIGPLRHAESLRQRATTGTFEPLRCGVITGLRESIGTGCVDLRARYIAHNSEALDNVSVSGSLQRRVPSRRAHTRIRDSA